MDYQTFAQSQQHEATKNSYINTMELNHIRRQQLNEIIDGHAFFPINTWPNYIQRAFKNTPITDKQAFVLITFFYGNGCAPTLLAELIYSSQIDTKKITKRFHQFKWICSNLETHAHRWYYHDIFHNRMLYLDRTPKEQ